MTKEKSPIPWKPGFTTSSETWNGRLAMVGFLLLLLIELLTGENIIKILKIM